MARYLTIRVLLGLLTILGVIVLTFALQMLVPGDPARRVAGPRASPETLAVVRENLRLDDSVPVQFGTYVFRVAQGDLGVSYVKRRPVADLLLERLPKTIALALSGLTISIVLGGGLGLWDGLRRRRSRVLAAANVVLLSIPTFTLGFLLLVVFAYRLGWLPLGGGSGPKDMILPALALGLFGMPYYAAVVAESVREALASTYMRTAVAKGLPRRTIIRRHVVRNSLSPVITLAGLDAAILISGVVLVEVVFGWPGIGTLQQNAFDDLDRPVLMGTVILTAFVVVAFNLLADVLRAFVDPRTREQGDALMAAVLEVEQLSVAYGDFEAVREASLTLEAGRTLALVGESGSGKSSLAHAIARLLPPEGRLTGGRIVAAGVDVGALTGAELRRFRGSVVGYLAQDAMAALNPVLRAGRQVSEVLVAREGRGRRAAAAGSLELLRGVGVQDPERVADAYPHELSGGMRQRVMIAMALAMRPAILVADEPTTALDVTVQAEILALAKALQAEHGTTLVWITHDMGVVAEIADEVAVMYGGRVVERGPARAVFSEPAHPYTAALLETVASARVGGPKEPFEVVAGQPPSDAVPPGCPFHPRCPRALPQCGETMPPTTAVGDGHGAACHLLGSTA